MKKTAPLLFLCFLFATVDLSAQADTASNGEKAVFEKVEIEASVNIADWRKNLEKQLPSYLEAAVLRGMKAGQYTVNVRFLVGKDGRITDVKALNDPGYGLALGAVRTVRTGPRWTPGEVGGKKVRSYHTQPITFQIAEK